MNSIATPHRIHSIDLLRGLVMMIMALDHVRDFFHITAMKDDPMNLETTTTALFFTRWITHYCAPTFVFLAGTSVFLMSFRKSKAELSGFLMKRGLWLILMEVLIVNPGWSFDPGFHTTVFQVIWAIGISMVLLGLCVRLPFSIILSLGLLIVFGHNTLDYFEAGTEKMGFWWDLVHHGGFNYYPYAPGHGLLIIYPFLPWTGIMLCGYCFGRFYAPDVDAAHRRKLLLYTGFAAMVLFVLLRAINVYGDPNEWDMQPGALFTLFSFVKVAKYPPSLLFILMTIGPACLLLLFFDRWKINGLFSRMLNVFGRVPFFYYVLHIYLIHILVVVAFFATGHTVSEILTPHSPFLFRPDNFGFSLPAVYLVWVLVLLILYPLCKRYDQYKTHHRKWWLSYL